MKQKNESGIGGGYKAAKVFKQYDPENNTVVDRAFLVKEKGGKAHLKRNAGTYAGLAGGAVAGLAAGTGIARKLGAVGLSGKGKAYAALVGAGLGSSYGDAVDGRRAKFRLAGELERQKKTRGMADIPREIGGLAKDPRTSAASNLKIRAVKHKGKYYADYGLSAIDEAVHFFMDLGEMRPDYSIPLDEPSADVKKRPMKKVFPQLSIYGRDAAIPMPDKGTAMVKYRVVRRSMDERDGKVRHDIGIEVQDMTPVMDAPKQELSARDVLTEFGLSASAYKMLPLQEAPFEIRYPRLGKIKSKVEDAVGIADLKKAKSSAVGAGMDRNAAARYRIRANQAKFNAEGERATKAFEKMASKYKQSATRRLYQGAVFKDEAKRKFQRAGMIGAGVAGAAGIAGYMATRKKKDQELSARDVLTEFGSGGVASQTRRALALKNKILPGIVKQAKAGASDGVLNYKVRPLLKADRRISYRKAMGAARELGKKGFDSDAVGIRSRWNEAMKNPEFLKRKQMLSRGEAAEALTFFASVGAPVRDGNGRFRADETGGADPVSMRAAYGIGAAGLAAGGALGYGVARRQAKKEVVKRAPGALASGLRRASAASRMTVNV